MDVRGRLREGPRHRNAAYALVLRSRIRAHERREGETSEESKHTDLPWSAQTNVPARSIDLLREHSLVGQANSGKFGVAIVFGHDGGKANSALIVKAVNAYADLTADHKAMKEALERY